MRNLFDDLPTSLPEELTETLLIAAGVRIERIVSTGQASPPGFWYDQPEGEWVVLLRGEATLRLADEPAPRRLRPGDMVHLLPRQRHRVEATSLSEPTVWLAVFYMPSASGEGS
jgi:cupin 2 domain-containing protein